MMVMVGYPDFLLKPEAVDKEYEVGLSLALPCPTKGGFGPLVKTPGVAHHPDRGGDTALS